MLGDGWLTRKEAALFLTNKGFPMTPQRLAHLAFKKKGPPMRTMGWRSVYYHRDKLLPWAIAIFGEVNE